MSFAKGKENMTAKQVLAFVTQKWVLATPPLFFAAQMMPDPVSVMTAPYRSDLQPYQCPVNLIFQFTQPRLFNTRHSIKPHTSTEVTVNNHQYSINIGMSHPQLFYVQLRTVGCLIFYFSTRASPPQWMRSYLTEFQLNFPVHTGWPFFLQPRQYSIFQSTWAMLI